MGKSLSISVCLPREKRGRGVKGDKKAVRTAGAITKPAPGVRSGFPGREAFVATAAA